MTQLHRNFPQDDRLSLGVVVPNGQQIFVQVVLQGQVKAHEEAFVQGILSAGRPVDISTDEFAKMALGAPECYLGGAALSFPLLVPGQRLGGPHGGE